MCDSEDEVNSIKALIVFKENPETGSLFVSILCDAIRTTGINVKCSLKEFWTSKEAYHIIHILNPDDVIDSDYNDTTLAKRLEERIVFFRQQGAKFVYTRRQECPPKANKIMRHVYDIIETQSDMIVHMGQYSLDKFTAKYPNSRNTIILPNIYDYTFKEDISIERARQYLNLPQEAFIVAACGKFSNNEERHLITSAFRQWKEDKKLLLVPRYHPYSRINKYGKNIFKRWASRLGYYVLMPIINKLYRMRAGASDEVLDICDLPYFIKAADVIFIPQKNNLNSDCIPIAFLFHKIIIGSDRKNVGELLRRTGNPTFDPDKRDEILQSLNEARQMGMWYQGESNYNFALEHMRSAKIGQEYSQLYASLTNN